MAFFPQIAPPERFALRDGSKMAEQGFKFAEFEPEYGRYRLSKPYELVIIRDTNTLTITQ